MFCKILYHGHTGRVDNGYCQVPFRAKNSTRDQSLEEFSKHIANKWRESHEADIQHGEAHHRSEVYGQLGNIDIDDPTNPMTWSGAVIED
jgi:hypothetical protein